MIGWETVLIAQAAFALGYLCGKSGRLTNSVKDEPKGFFAANKPKQRVAEPDVAPAQKIEIDDRKIVSQISTDSIQKVTHIELGTKTAVADDINASVNRLSQLKGK
jgi:hypothetical protein